MRSFKFSVALFILSQSLFAGVSLIPAGGIGLLTPKYEVSGTALTPAGKIGITAGLGLGIPLYKALEFEIGAYYAQRKYEIGISGITITQEFPMLLAPALFRIRPGRYFSIGFGGYFATKAGKIKTTALSITTESEWDAAGAEDMDYGLMGSITFEIPLGKSAYFVIDGRYLFGLQDVAKASDVKLNLSDIEALGGFRFVL